MGYRLKRISALRVLLVFYFCCIGADVSWADINCGTPTVLAAFTESFKCQELAVCADDTWGNLRTAQAVEGATNEVIENGVEVALTRQLSIYLTQGSQSQRNLFRAIIELKKRFAVSLRDLFKTISVQARPVDYDPSRKRYTCEATISWDDGKLHTFAGYEGVVTAVSMPTVASALITLASENRDPMPLLTATAKGGAASFSKCLNRVRRFTVQPTVGNEFIVNLDKNFLIPGCS